MPPDDVIRWPATVPAGMVPAAISMSRMAVATSPVDSTESSGMPSASPTSRSEGPKASAP